LLAITSGSRTFSARNCSLKTLRPSCQAAFTFSSVLGHSMPRSMMILLSVAIKMESVWKQMWNRNRKNDAKLRVQGSLMGAKDSNLSSIRSHTHQQAPYLWSAALGTENHCKHHHQLPTDIAVYWSRYCYNMSLSRSPWTQSNYIPDDIGKP
jgi:hypothetical protein